MASNFPATWQPPNDAPFGHEWWYITGLETNGSSAVATQIAVGDIVCADWGATAAAAIVSAGLDASLATFCTRPQSELFPSRKGVVVFVPTGVVNSGYILVRTAPGVVKITVPATNTIVGDVMLIADDSYKVAESGALSDLSVAEAGSIVGYALEANAAGAAALKWCYFSPVLFR